MIYWIKDQSDIWTFRMNGECRERLDLGVTQKITGYRDDEFMGYAECDCCDAKVATFYICGANDNEGMYLQTDSENVVEIYARKSNKK